MAAQWYLVHAQTGRETVAEANLARQGYATFLPVCLRTVRHARKTQSVRSAYFPGYLFVGIDLEAQAWRPINGTLGVVRLVTANDRPMPTPKGLIEALRALASPEGLMARRPVLAPGDAVRLADGALEGALGRVESLGGADRVRVLLELMNRSVAVDLPLAACVPA